MVQTSRMAANRAALRIPERIALRAREIGGSAESLCPNGGWGRAHARVMTRAGELIRLRVCWAVRCR